LESCSLLTCFHTLVSSAKRPRLECLTSLLMSDISMRKSRGPITLPCGTPDLTHTGSDVVPSTTTVQLEVCFFDNANCRLCQQITAPWLRTIQFLFLSTQFFVSMVVDPYLSFTMDEIIRHVSNMLHVPL
jgi:hypothetical protein